MFKTVFTLFRGSVAAAGEELEGRNALLILDQQMRDAAAFHWLFQLMLDDQFADR